MGDVKTSLIKVNTQDLDRDTAEGEAQRKNIEYAGTVIKEGGLVAFPTETVYGLGGDAFNPDSSRRIYAAKGRPSDNPLIVHIYSKEQLPEITEKVPEEAYILADTFWPGPLTMVLNGNGRIPRETTGGLSTVAVRLPSDPVAKALIKAAGGFIAAPSANLSGRPSPTSAAHCMEDLDGRVDVVIDSGESIIGLESTIVDLTDGSGTVTLLRPGFITVEELRKALQGKAKVLIDPAVAGVNTGKRTEDGEECHPRAPGMKYRHYAPRGELTIVRGDSGRVAGEITRRLSECAEKGLRTAVIASGDTAASYRADLIISIGESTRDEEGAAHGLFTALRRCDDENCDVIFSEAFGDGESGVSLAVMNRLIKASGGSVIDV